MTHAEALRMVRTAQADLRASRLSAHSLLGVRAEGRGARSGASGRAGLTDALLGQQRAHALGPGQAGVEGLKRIVDGDERDLPDERLGARAQRPLDRQRRSAAVRRGSLGRVPQARLATDVVGTLSGARAGP